MGPKSSKQYPNQHQPQIQPPTNQITNNPQSSIKSHSNNKQSPKKPSKASEEKISLNSFHKGTIIGRGGFGKVWRVTSLKHKKHFAMKEMAKTKIIDKQSVHSVLAERDLLANMNHPFIINMHFAFQDNANIYIVMDLLTGGDLRYQLGKEPKKGFNEEQTKFFMACIILSLEYCHYNNILHRDLKPENLVLDSKGYVKLTDFGIAKPFQKNNRKENSGTPGYMAPEVMYGFDYTKAVDYFALGVIGYEFMMGSRPYQGRTRNEIKERIMSRQVMIKQKDLPPNWSLESADFINRLLQRKPLQRLGTNGADEVKEHAWFKYYNWKDIYLGNMTSPYIPKHTDNYDSAYCNGNELIKENTQERYIDITNSLRFDNPFRDFYPFNRYSSMKVQTKLHFAHMRNPHDNYTKTNEEVENEALTSIHDGNGNSIRSSISNGNGNGNGNGGKCNTMKHSSSTVKIHHNLENDKYITLKRSTSSLLRNSSQASMSSWTNTGTVNSKMNTIDQFKK